MNMIHKLDAQVAYLLQGIARANLPNYADVGIIEARKHYHKVAPSLCVPSQVVAYVEDVCIDALSHQIHTRWYWSSLPNWSSPQPVLIWFHGGGFNVGGLNTSESLCRMLANAANCVVVAVAYRLAPEHKFPAAFEDTWLVLQHICKEAGRYGVLSDKIVVGGESAGAALAASCAIAARDHGLRLSGQLLITPHTDFDLSTESHLLFGNGFLLDTGLIEWFFNNYLNHISEKHDWRFAVSHATSHESLAKAWIAIASHDPLRDDGLKYAEQLRAAGNDVEYTLFDGMIHGFFGMGGVIHKAKSAHQRAINFLQKCFGHAF